MNRTATAKPRTDPRVLRTGKLVMDAFMAVLEQKGFESMSVQDIVEKAEINRATFYDHFKDKIDLMNQLLRATFKEELQKHIPAKAVSGKAGVRELLDTVCAFLSGIHAHCKPPHDQLDSLIESEVKALIMEALNGPSEGRTSTAGRLSLREMRGVAAAWSLYGLALLWVRKGGQNQRERFINRAVPLLEDILRS
jgi:AcrR family transcriptional regulator